MRSSTLRLRHAGSRKWTPSRFAAFDGEQDRVAKKSRQRPTLPHGCPCSTIGSEELNFRVRDGIGCGLLEITTGNLWIASTPDLLGLPAREGPLHEVLRGSCPRGIAQTAQWLSSQRWDGILAIRI